MRHNEHVARTPIATLIFADMWLMVLCSDLANERIHTADYVLGRFTARTPICPDIPWSLALFLADLPDFFARYALVVAVVPLADLIRDRDLGIRVPRDTRTRARVCLRGRRGIMPGEWIGAAQVQELEGPLCAVHGRNVAGHYISSLSLSIHGNALFAVSRVACLRYLHVLQLSRDDKPVVSDEGFACCSYSLFAVGCQGDVGDAGVFA